MPELLHGGGPPRAIRRQHLRSCRSIPTRRGRARTRARFIGPFEVDLYQYPPAFLVLPRAPVAAGLDFLTIRKLWFAVQSIVLFATMVLLARWIGGSSGLLVLLLVPVVWLSPTTRLALQIGNFQLTAFALTVLAMIAFDRGRVGRGGFALGFAAVSKIYPGLLGVLLIARRQWRAVAWTVAWSAAFTAAAWLMVGSAPFVDFFRYQLPRIESGQAFFWMETADVAPINFGVHGLVIKLRFLGLPWTGPEAASRAASLYAVLLLPLAAVSAWRLRALGAGTIGPERLRLRQAQVWLGLLSLASFRSPFVPDAYALFGTLWLLTLVAAEGHWQARGRIALVVGGAIAMTVLDGGPIPAPGPGVDHGGHARASSSRRSPSTPRSCSRPGGRRTARRVEHFQRVHEPTAFHDGHDDTIDHL